MALISLETLLDRIRQYHKADDLDIVKKAYNYAMKKHEGQMRKSGEPYVTHPVQVAYILADMELDPQSICAALLHDVVEDTETTREELVKEFGETVTMLVDGVTKLNKIPYTSKEEQQIENLRKMFFAMAKDVRVIVIKLADRLHNMRTLKYQPEEKQREIARETLEVYAPLAHRLGMSKIKWELEDLALRYIDPIGYYEIVDKIAQKREEREKYIKDIINILQEKLDSLHIKAHVEGRAKHFYSIYRKMFMQNKTIDELYDLFAVRVIVDTVADCYSVLGMVHELFKPIPGRFKDYIAMPKPNMYQSLHSTLIGPNGTPFEIQIRTWEMHHTAENGIAAHWKYKEGKSGASDMDSKLEWIKQLLEIQKDMTNAEDFMQTLKIDMFSDEVFVFTPKGDVISLPVGATPIDFAYAIHSAVGNRMTGAKVNGKIVTLDYTLQNGDIVDIITTGGGHGPNLDWIKICKTSQARNKINQWFKKVNREENMAKGHEILEKALKQLSIPLSFLEDKPFLQNLLRKYGFNNIEDMYAAIGYGSPNATRFVTRFKTECKKRIVEEEVLPPEEVIPMVVKTTSKPNNSGVIVEGIDNCLTRFSHCCNPVPGDKIVGYVTRGRGVAIHRADCINMIHAQANSEELNRFIPVRWADDTDNTFQSMLYVTATDRANLLLDIMTTISEMKTHVTNVNARTGKNNLAIIELTMEISDTAQLEQTIKRLKKVDSVLSVVRRRQ
ncbi:RelA/SpoT family protein [Ructibacterium gallinarum]|uniref:GTP diphosphokinase n=1 Tax=Ructibacterium gallinarum TaxID=2779355 RepID=A0A9D5LXZ3_9FIRM|nr:bifunctional (p)ppGpp synthetase/guanosine-3',5'-bis(diphosphate) 3'-pyrophosphohydrolase [Ructibacterium gallinarum]MBE5040021.1 bifunctional (p)ppGpp synthetase/guanosine-3',5'-bis(diphosphate) 3'-pyrophosphohydrolase [Ructibacterium gallinarum]